MILFRPTGLAELRLVQASGWLDWPPRLPDQPIFYPVTTFDYAEKIARDWNAVGTGDGRFGFVTEFTISKELAERYPVQVAGGRDHTELWVPAEELAQFNKGIIGEIKLVAAYADRKRIELSEVTDLLKT